MMTGHPIPDIPGELLTDQQIRHFLASRVGELCGTSESKFPGSQPISFSAASLDLLEKKDFWVCEKSDGVRVLVFIVFNGMTEEQEVWLIDRKQRFFRIRDLHFPHWERNDDPLGETLLDGELVIDIDPKTGEALRFYAFDCLVLHGENIMSKTLVKRFARLREWVIGPYEKALKQIPEWRDVLPFEILAKKQELSYHIAQVLNVHVPQLQHGHDGLIFTCAESEYVAGTDPMILKWKPPSENSIDFKLELRFPPDVRDPSQPDFEAKPAFLLNTWLGGHEHEFFDVMDVDDEEWETMKQSGEQYDDRVIEVCWDVDRETWRYMRIRDDKPNANHKDIMRKIIASIEDGVEIEALLARSDQIRSAWKARAAARQGGAPTPGAGHGHQQQGQQQARRPNPPYQGGGGGGHQPPTPGARAPITPGASFAGGQGIVAGLKR